MDRLTIPAALEQLAMVDHTYTEVFWHGTLNVGIYKPEGVDLQTPHLRDEIYVIASGRGYFTMNGETRPVDVGEVLFVPAGTEHKFLDFSDDFSTWVFFYGPKGGEVPREAPEETANDATAAQPHQSAQEAQTKSA